MNQKLHFPIRINTFLTRIGIVLCLGIALLIGLSSCEDPSASKSEPDPDPPPAEPDTSLPGFYEAVVFIEPGSKDGGGDILENGGILTAELSEDSTVSGEILIPPDIEIDWPPVDTVYGGTYRVKGDSIWFIDAGIQDIGLLLDLYSPFLKNDIHLENLGLTDTPWPSILVLEKKKN